MILLLYSNFNIKGAEILAVFYIFIFYDRPFVHVYNVEEHLLFLV